MNEIHRRHRRWLAVTLVTGLIAVPSLAAGRPSDGERIAVDAAMAARIDDVARRAMQETPLAGMSLAVQRNGEIVFADGYGSADLGRAVPATADTVYQIGSVSKQFTAAAVVRAAGHGLLSLDDPASDYAQLPPADPGPTVAQLLSHTSGVVDAVLGPALEESRDGAGMTTPEALELAIAPGLAWLPGSFYQYGNGNYLLSYEVVAAATGRSYDEYLVDEVIRRAGLSDTTLCPPEPTEGWAVGYHIAEGKWARAMRLGRPLPLIEGWHANMDIIKVVCSTAPDLVRWARALRSGQVVTTDHYRLMASGTELADGTVVPYGLGLQLRRFGDHEAVSHGGLVAGFVSLLADFPEEDVSVAMLLNTRLDEPDVTLLLELLLGAVFDEPEGNRWTADLGSPTLEGDTS